MKQQSTPQKNKIHSIFKDYVELGRIQTEPILMEMLAYAKRYQILLDGKTGNTALNACIYRLNRLETTVTRPFFLEVLRLYDENKLTMEQVTEIFLTAENYLFRRSICDLPTNALNKIFLMLHREIMRYDDTETDYVEKFKYALLSHKSEIESALGATLSWNRFEDKKASKVYTQLSNVSIENEVDWLQMARFHADWSKKFYDVIVPFIVGAI